jgi:hypothetical protein
LAGLLLHEKRLNRHDLLALIARSLALFGTLWLSFASTATYLLFFQCLPHSSQKMQVGVPFLVPKYYPPRRPKT